MMMVSLYTNGAFAQTHYCRWSYVIVEFHFYMPLCSPLMHMYLTMVYSAVSPKMIKWNNLFEIEIATVNHIALRYEDHNRMAIKIAVIKLPLHQGEK